MHKKATLGKKEPMRGFSESHCPILSKEEEEVTSNEMVESRLKENFLSRSGYLHWHRPMRGFSTPPKRRIDNFIDILVLSIGDIDE